MIYYRKPVVSFVDAYQLTNNLEQLSAWCGIPVANLGNFNNDIRAHYDSETGSYIFAVSCGPAVLRAKAGDWIIRNERGQHGVCRKEDFDTLYSRIPNL